MAVRLASAANSRRPSSPNSELEPSSWTCAFVNNMPDGAFDATERQFLDLLGAGSGSDVIEIHRYAMDGVPRSERTASRIAECYSPVADITDNPPDLLIVTGSNPLEVHIQDEPYWAELVDLLSWASVHVRSMLLSCLSAHAALKTFDGLERVRLDSKCTGVFPQHVETRHPLCLGLESEIPLPHSRWNTVSPDDMREVGYDIVIQSSNVGWSVATREIAASTVVLIQGHPEYEPSSLLREYRRDASRYVLHERDDVPCLPAHCVAPEDWEQLESLHRAIIGGQRNPAILAAFPFDEIAERSLWTWRTMALQFFENWLSYDNSRKS